ncbi:T9SS type A sorting domain-containing protein [bacterium]|nr:T9SS type A sorting domain-containing protein [bacterium]
MKPQFASGRVAITACLIGIFFSMCIPGSFCNAQLPQTFTLKSSNPHMTSASALAYAGNDLLFILGDNGGLWAYRVSGGAFEVQGFYPAASAFDRLEIAPDGVIYLSGRDGQLTALIFAGNEFVSIASSAISVEQNDMAIGPDGTIYLASGYAGLVALRREGAAFRLIAQDAGIEKARAVAVGADNTIFVAGAAQGELKAYELNGRNLIPAGEINSDAFTPTDLVAGDDGMVFLADAESGLSAYTFDKHALIRVAELNDGGTAQRIAVANNRSIYIAKADAGICGYIFDGSRFHSNGTWSCSNADARDLATREDGTVLIADGNDGVRLICCDATRSACLAHCDQNTDARSVAVTSDGIVLLANGMDGLRAYRDTEPILECVAWTNHDASEDIHACAVTVDQRDRVFLAHDNSLSVYTLSYMQFNHIASTSIVGECRSIAVSPTGWVYVACGENGLRVFQFDGATLFPVAHAYECSFAYDVSVGEDGSVYVATGENGLRVYRMLDGDFHCTAQYHPMDPVNGKVLSVTAGPDATVFLACSRDGLMAFRNTGTALTPLDIIDFFPYMGDYAGATSVHRTEDGSILFHYETYPGMDIAGLYACVFENDRFSIRAHFIEADNAVDITSGADNNVYVLKSDGGVLGYHYNSLPPAPSIKVSQQEVDFGEVPIGANRYQSVSIANEGSTPLRIRDQRLSSFEAERFEILEPLPDRIRPGECSRLRLRFSSSREGPMQTDLIILTDAPDCSEIHLPVRAVASGNCVHSDAGITSLDQNTPNPFNPSTTIRFRVADAGKVSLEVYDLIGKRIATLMDGMLPAGQHTVHFNAADLPSGMYFYRMHTDNAVITRRMILTK